jgi:hypothetical protein
MSNVVDMEILHRYAVGVMQRAMCHAAGVVERGPRPRSAMRKKLFTARQRYYQLHVVRQRGNGQALRIFV